MNLATHQDTRWKQRFHNYLRAFQTLVEAVELNTQRDLSKLEQQGLIQSFEYTHELAWNVLKDYLEYKGVIGLIGSRDATREAFKYQLITEGETWMNMIKLRNLTSHSYSEELAQAVAKAILEDFYPAFTAFAQKFTLIIEQVEND